MCAEIGMTVPRRVQAEFAKGKHITVEQALDRIASSSSSMSGEAAMAGAAVSTVMRQEIERYDRLLALIHGSMDELVRALRGEIVISKTCENVFESFLMQRVPAEWAACAYPSVKPLAAWLKNLCKRVRFFALWCTNLVLFVEGVSDVHCNPISIWISGFFFPQGTLFYTHQDYIY